MNSEYYKQVNLIIDPILKEYGVELVDLAIRFQNRTYSVDILADKPQGGITLDICGKLNLKISDQLETEDIFDESYVVSVSSPGLDRPLRTFKDFKRVIGREVRFYLSDKIFEKLEHVGIVQDVNEQEITINQNKESLIIPIDKVNKAIQEI